MSSVPFLYINLISLCCYFLLFLAFLAAKKTAEIRSFIVVLLGFTLWTGGSILMRLQAFPGVPFWYYVSILALFSLGLLIYYFVCSFAKVKGWFLKTIWTVGTVVILIITVFGVFLKPPQISVTDSGTFFMYTMEWPIVIPCIFFLFIVASIVKILRDVIKENGAGTPGVKELIFGCLAVVIGNMVQIIPGNVFPWDTLSGIVFALFLMSALYKKRMFRLTLLISRNVIIFVSLCVCLIVGANFINPVLSFMTDTLSLSSTTASVIMVLLFTGTLGGVYLLLRALLDTLFNREEQQNHILKQFSESVNRSLSTNAIMDLLVKTIKEEIPTDHVYVCLREGSKFVSRKSSSPLAPSSFSISADSPCISQVRKGESCFLMSDFRSSPSYMSMWEEEKLLLMRINLGCVVALKDGDGIVGLILLSAKDHNSQFTYNELSFLDTVSSIASIAVKNASLYERVYREARIDSLTGVFNYKYFMEKAEEDFNACGNECLSLLYLDMDDFKLYNQLYGTVEGDKILKETADIISRVTGSAGTVFRHSGKVFAVLLPGLDGQRAESLAMEIQRMVSDINNTPERCHHKSLSISGGICVSPQAASSVKELIENADLAVYNAKNSGKNKIVLFKGSEKSTQRISQKAHDIIQQGGDNPYGESSQTIYALTAAIDAKDHYTGRHSQNVANYASILATAAGLNDEQIRMIYAAALLHDIGKISVPESILRKSGRLNDSEIAIMNEHVNNSIEMMRHLPSMDYLIPAAVGHHERWDGTGYPRGIKGDDIPVSARCLAIADSFDAMTTDRPYRKALSVEYATEQISKNAGTQFDPQLAMTFVDLLKCGEIVLNK